MLWNQEVRRFVRKIFFHLPSVRSAIWRHPPWQPPRDGYALWQRRQAPLGAVHSRRHVRYLRRSEALVFVDLCKNAARGLPTGLASHGGGFKPPALCLVRVTSRRS